ncbi:MAG: hypothetical protein JJ975_09965 [Bacteroidia bacterium]|nr:hypothetical protein [Bacteroidia bacterium]
MSENQYDNTGEKRNRVSLPLLVLFLMSLALNAYLFYNWYQNNYQDGKSYKEINAELQEVLSQTEFSKDSLQKEYDLLSQQYQTIYDQQEELQLERSEALDQLEKKKIRILQLLNQSNSSPRELVKAKGEIEKLRVDIKNYVYRLDSVLADNARYKSEITAYQSYGEELEERKRIVEEQNQVLEAKMEEATLRISDLVVKPMRQKRKGLEETSKSSKVDEIEVSFTVLESPMIYEGDKEIVLRIIGTNGEVLGADNSMLTDSDKLVSMKKPFTYDGTEQDFKMRFKQEEAYKKGGHYAEIWSEGKMITRSPFNLE